MSPDEFADILGDLGEELSDTQARLAELGANIVSAMKLRVPVDTGALKNSIRYVMQGDDLSFEMLFYGPFQNYGVKGTAGPNVSPVPFGVSPQPTNPPFYAFQSREFGFGPQRFFDLEEIQEAIAQAITPQL